MERRRGARHVGGCGGYDRGNEDAGPGAAEPRVGDEHGGADLTGLRSTLSSLARAHGGTLPTTGQLTQMQSEQLSGSIGQALEGLAQVPGALETTTTPVIPQIPAKDVRIVP